MTGEFILTILCWVAGAWLIVSAALILWGAATIYRLKGQIRRLRQPPQVMRDPNGRPLKERI